eukprot:NODE_4627_length_1139_cov_59.658465_g4107_i0.p1 GENE.NODE_4627_length_1139_cov_59.658465_g4107_i0~~NODE_4627_length_1139_cov_59.658465_g4107_i0.p1  ORF type:complete len:227 (+),score=53.82 NODE_4627_length_1139_cov_59.658465_g4107_i0:329-1009(+)
MAEASRPHHHSVDIPSSSGFNLADLVQTHQVSDGQSTDNSGPINPQEVAERVAAAALDKFSNMDELIASIYQLVYKYESDILDLKNEYASLHEAWKMEEEARHDESKRAWNKEKEEILSTMMKHNIGSAEGFQKHFTDAKRIWEREKHELMTRVALLQNSENHVKKQLEEAQKRWEEERQHLLNSANQQTGNARTNGSSLDEARRHWDSEKEELLTQIAILQSQIS